MDDREQLRKSRHRWGCFAMPRSSQGTSRRRAVGSGSAAPCSTSGRTGSTSKVLRDCEIAARGPITTPPTPRADRASAPELPPRPRTHRDAPQALPRRRDLPLWSVERPAPAGPRPAAGQPTLQAAHSALEALRDLAPGQFGADRREAPSPTSTASRPSGIASSPPTTTAPVCACRASTPKPTSAPRSDSSATSPSGFRFPLR